MLIRMLANGLALGAVLSPLGAFAQSTPRTFQPEAMKFSEVVNGTATVVDYRGRRAVKLIPAPDAVGSDKGVFAIVTGTELTDGTIDVDVAGAPRADAAPDSRGFIGVSFHVEDHAKQSEVLYIRPTNGRSDDQLRRNHSVQYVSNPDYPWERLRKENPGVYESYADMEAGVWTHMRIVIAGKTARLFVNNASQPCLVVNDLKRGAVGGAIAFWAHASTDGYFGALKVRAN